MVTTWIWNRPDPTLKKSYRTKQYSQNILNLINIWTRPKRTGSYATEIPGYRSVRKYSFTMRSTDSWNMWESRGQTRTIPKETDRSGSLAMYYRKHEQSSASYKWEIQRLPYPGGSQPKGESFLQDKFFHGRVYYTSTWGPRHKPPCIHQCCGYIGTSD